jgi:RNA polymerase sigma-70 factor (ECF subfamily)
VAGVLAELPRVQQEIFILSRIDGLTYEAVGKSLGMPTQTVYSHVVRILMRLEQRFRRLHK